MKMIFDFLSELKDNNNREWFEANKTQFTQAKELFETKLAQVIEGLIKIDPTINRPLPKDCVFRIYRDVRFSPNKLPYKTHFGAYIADGGRKSSRAGYYMHIEPGNSLIGGGIYMPAADVLKKIRAEIYFDAKGFKDLLNQKDFKEQFGNLYEDKLSRNPKDYDANFPDIELLKYKSYFMEKHLTDEQVLAPDYVSNILGSYQSMVKVNMFLNRAFNN